MVIPGVKEFVKQKHGTSSLPATLNSASLSNPLDRSTYGKDILGQRTASSQPETRDVLQAYRATPPVDSQLHTNDVEMKNGLSCTDRQRLGDQARFKSTATNSGHHLPQANSSVSLKKGRLAEPEDQIKQEFQFHGGMSQDQKEVGEVWDTDADNIDDTSTLSYIQVPETQQQAYYEHDRQSPLVETQVQSQGQMDWMREPYTLSDGGGEQFEDEESSEEGSSEGIAADDDPTIDNRSQDVFSRLFKSKEEQADFVEMMRQKKAGDSSLPYGFSNPRGDPDLPPRIDLNRITAQRQSKNSVSSGHTQFQTPQSSSNPKLSSQTLIVETHTSPAGILRKPAKRDRGGKNLQAIQKSPDRPRTSHGLRSDPTHSDDEVAVAPQKQTSVDMYDRGIQVDNQTLYERPKTSHLIGPGASASDIDRQQKFRKQNSVNEISQNIVDEPIDCQEPVEKQSRGLRRSHTSLSDIETSAPTQEKVSNENQRARRSPSTIHMDRQENATSPFEDIVTGTADIKLEGSLNGNRKRALELDYDSDQLSQIPFSDLKSQPFDHDPRAPPVTFPEDLISTSLPEKLSYLASASDPATRDSQQKAFYASLSIDDYEECGSLLVEQLSSIVRKFNNLRRQKRAVAVEFEAEIAKREEMVREKEGFIEKDLGRLRRMGEDVLRGKGF